LRFDGLDGGFDVALLVGLGLAFVNGNQQAVAAQMFVIAVTAFAARLTNPALARSVRSCASSLSMGVSERY
jgi:hypothetical protein